MTKVSMHQQGIIILNMFAPNSFKMHEVKHKRTELDKSIIMVRDSNIPFSKYDRKLKRIKTRKCIWKILIICKLTHVQVMIQSKEKYHR